MPDFAYDFLARIRAIKVRRLLTNFGALLLAGEAVSVVGDRRLTYTLGFLWLLVECGALLALAFAVYSTVLKLDDAEAYIELLHSRASQSTKEEHRN